MRWFPSYLDVLRMRLALLALLFLSYFGSLWVGSLHFPHAYDWRRNVISNLLSPRDNPGWYWIPSGGVAVAGLCMLQLGAWIDARTGDGQTSLARRVRKPAFLVGIGCLTFAALIVPQHTHPVLGNRHMHEVLARTSALGLGIGMLCACIGTARDQPRLRTLRLIWRVITLPPVIGAAISGAIVALSRLAGLAGIAGPAAASADIFRQTVFWHLAFWEWAGSVAVFLFFAAPAAML